MSDGREKRRINRRQNGDAVARFADRAGHEVHSSVHAGCENDPGRVHDPAIVSGEMVDDGLDRGAHRQRIPEHRMIDAAMQCFEHTWRRGKIHVGHPHRENIATGIALPFLAAGIATVDDSVEVEAHR